MGSFRDDECYSHPDNDDPRCAFCAAHRVGLRGHEALYAGQQATMIRLQNHWVRTTRPASPGRADWVELWTSAGQRFRAWWGHDEGGEPTREIEGVDAPFSPHVRSDQRCDAVELARIWFPDPLVAATLLNGLPSKVAAHMAAELHHRFSDRVQGDLDRLRDLAVRGAELGLDEKVLSWWYDLDELARQFEEWAPWREVKAAPPAANFSYSTLIDRLSALGPDVARQWVPVVGVDAALVWWQLGASPADAERALCEISAEFPDLASLEPAAAAAFGAFRAVDPGLGSELREVVLQRAAMARAWRSAGMRGRWRWRMRALARRLNASRPVTPPHGPQEAVAAPRG